MPIIIAIAKLVKRYVQNTSRLIYSLPIVINKLMVLIDNPQMKPPSTFGMVSMARHMKQAPLAASRKSVYAAIMGGFGEQRHFRHYLN